MFWAPKYDNGAWHIGSSNIVTEWWQLSSLAIVNGPTLEWHRDQHHHLLSDIENMMVKRAADLSYNDTQT